MPELKLCVWVAVTAFTAAWLSGCGVQQTLDTGPPRPEAEMAHFDGANICQLAADDISATANMGRDRWFRKVTYDTLPGRQSVRFCRWMPDPNSDPALGRYVELNPCRADLDARAGGDYRVASVDVRNQGEHCQVSYTLEDAGRAVLGCTVEYGEGCPWFGFGWATMPSIGESTWKSAD